MRVWRHWSPRLPGWQSAAECRGIKVNPCFSKLTYPLLTCRCVRDETYQSYSSPSPRISRFKFSSFHFLNRFPSVYLQCKLVVCRAYDVSSRCYRGCIVRSKRDVGSYQEKVDVVLGPIQLQSPSKEKRSLGRWLPLDPTFHWSHDSRGGGKLGCFCLCYGPTQTAYKLMN